MTDTNVSTDTPTTFQIGDLVLVNKLVVDPHNPADLIETNGIYVETWPFVATVIHIDGTPSNVGNIRVSAYNPPPGRTDGQRSTWWVHESMLTKLGKEEDLKHEAPQSVSESATSTAHSGYGVRGLAQVGRILRATEATPVKAGDYLIVQDLEHISPNRWAALRADSWENADGTFASHRMADEITVIDLSEDKHFEVRGRMPFAEVTDALVVAATVGINFRDSNVRLQNKQEEIIERLHEEANSRGWCDEFDTIMDELELPRREREVEFRVTVQFQSTLIGPTATDLLGEHLAGYLAEIESVTKVDVEWTRPFDLTITTSASEDDIGDEHIRDALESLLNGIDYNSYTIEDSEVLN